MLLMLMLVAGSVQLQVLAMLILQAIVSGKMILGVDGARN